MLTVEKTAMIIVILLPYLFSLILHSQTKLHNIMGLDLIFPSILFIIFSIIFSWSLAFKQICLGFFLIWPHKLKCSVFITFKVVPSWNSFLDFKNCYSFSFITFCFYFVQNFLFNFFSLRFFTFNTRDKSILNLGILST